VNINSSLREQCKWYTTNTQEREKRNTHSIFRSYSFSS
jgi:hypothetical protein